jgi:hypothetical protein
MLAMALQRTISLCKKKREQSTNPFQTDIEALRAVSTVPPITTNFWEFHSNY